LAYKYATWIWLMIIFIMAFIIYKFMTLIDVANRF